MKQIVLTCVFFLVLLVAIVGCLVIFDVMSFRTGVSTTLKFGAAILFLGACAAVAMLFFGKR